MEDRPLTEFVDDASDDDADDTADGGTPADASDDDADDTADGGTPADASDDAEAADASAVDGNDERRDAGGHEPSGGADVTGDESTAVDATGTADPPTASAVSTSRWDGDGIECPACGSTVSRLWHEDGNHVCGACKRW